MELKRRYIFHGDAVALGGRIVRPDDIVLDPLCASTLPVTGGRTSNKIKRMKFGKYVRFDSASTLTQGLFDSKKQHVALTRGKALEEELISTTTVRAEVLGLVVGIKPQLTVKRLRGSFSSKSGAQADDETMIRLGNDAAIDGVAIGGHKLIVELNKKPFQEHDTYTKLRNAAGDQAFLTAHASSFLVGATVAGRQSVGLVEARGYIHGTIVKSIRWAGTPYPDATIKGHIVKVPAFGRIYFGEILIARDSRRVTTLRVEFGSPFGGSMACADYQDNGGWSP